MAQSSRRTQQLPVGSVPRYQPTRPLRYTMTDIERESGISARTVRYYVSEGLLPPAYGRGPSATYDADHLLRLQYIQRLKNDRLSLEQIKEHLADLSPEMIASTMRIDLEPSFETWRHYALHEDLDIAVRERRGGERNVEAEEAIALIVEYARTVIADLDERTNGND